jgi:hypothetical protein
MEALHRSSPRRTSSPLPGVKFFITVGAVAVTLSGWAVLAAPAPTQQPMVQVSPPELPLLPTVVPVAGAPPVAVVPSPPAAAPVLRQVSAPPAPIATTRSSR